MNDFHDADDLLVGHAFINVEQNCTVYALFLFFRQFISQPINGDDPAAYENTAAPVNTNHGN